MGKQPNIREFGIVIGDICHKALNCLGTITAISILSKSTRRLMKAIESVPEALDERSGFKTDFNDIEIGRLTQAEYEFANLQHELFLEKERAERETLDREFEEELGQLLKTIRAVDTDTNTIDPSGWPGL